MATIDSLNRAKRKLERFQHEQDQVITRLGNEVTRLWDAGGRPGHPIYDAAWKKWDAAKSIRGEYGKKYQDAVNAEQAALDQQNAAADAQAHEHAAKIEQTEKTTARAAYLRNGGDPAAFEGAWPGLWARLVTERTAGELLASKTEPPVQAVEY